MLATPDVIEDLALLGALDDKVVFGTMNRGGLSGAVFEMDDRFTAYTAESIAAAGLDGGKMMLRVHDDDPGTLATMTACAEAIGQLAALRLPAMVEVFADSDDPDALMRAVTIASGLGATSAYTWLKLPAVQDMPRVLSATTLPTVLLGGDPGSSRSARSLGRVSPVPAGARPGRRPNAALPIRRRRRPSRRHRRPAPPPSPESRLTRRRSG